MDSADRFLPDGLLLAVLSIISAVTFLLWLAIIVDSNLVIDPDQAADSKASGATAANAAAVTAVSTMIRLWPTTAKM